MTDETFEEPQASDFMTQESFSFFDVLDGTRTYPKDTIVMYMDESAAYELGKLIDELEVAEEDQAEELGRRVHDLQKRIQNSKFTFYLTGIPDDLATGVKDIADEKFKDRRLQRKTASGALERYLPESAQTDYIRFFSALTLSLHIEKIVQESTGREQRAPIDPDEVAALMDKAPSHEKSKLHVAVDKLRVQSRDFEASIDEGFLAKP